ncbi:F-box protein PP2 [Quillaja saponaria]|uniref:F-box protein PP2 n=1 Tax=Quillaja saponaria TaxID=32244 RepID=A0AAD7Q2U0_QUISA|nr:F-box protein PP2 [Quillaja saponaria]
MGRNVTCLLQMISLSNGGEDSRYWVWQPLPESRFAEVAMLANVCWLEIRGKIRISVLSSATRYGVYLVLKMIDAYGFNYHAAEVSVRTVGGVSFTKSVCLDPDIENRVISSAVDSRNLVEMERPKERSDGWLEIELGEFSSLGQEDDELEMCLKEVEGGNWKSGLTVQGIEIRPKEDN